MSSGPTVEIAGGGTRSRRTVLEMIAVLLLGASTVATAWCGIQASRWNGEETELARVAASARFESTELSALAAQKVAYDANVTAQYAAAFASGNTQLADFLRENLVRPDFLPVLDDWQARIQAGDEPPTNLFADEDYLTAQFGDARAAEAASAAAFADAEDASTHADAYVLVTLVTATALFFAGITTSFKTRMAQLVLVAIGAVVLAAAAARLSELPVL